MAYGYRKSYGGRGGYKSSYGRGRSYNRPAYKKSYRTQPRYIAPSTVKSSAMSQAVVYYDPFSEATTNPKIPDGKTSLSSGVKLQAVKEMINNNSGNMDLLFFPGLNNGLVAFNTVKDTNQNAITVDQLSPYTNHGSLTFNNQATSGDNIQGNGQRWYEQAGAHRIAKWRLVSQAMRLTLVNNSDENDGWWEAVRFQVPITRDEIVLCTDEPSKQSYICMDPHKAQNGASSIPGMDTYSGPQTGAANLVEHPSYVTGKLRDIHKYAFQLRATDTNHPFRQMQVRYIFETFFEAGRGIERFAEQTKAIEDLLDASYDVIFIRIHGRPGPPVASTANNTATRILSHIVSNQEIVYEQSSFLSRYSTETALIPNFEDAASKVMNQKKRAAEPNGDPAKRRRMG